MSASVLRELASRNLSEEAMKPKRLILPDTASDSSDYMGVLDPLLKGVYHPLLQTVYHICHGRCEVDPIVQTTRAGI
jgi:hypothetical protein